MLEKKYKEIDITVDDIVHLLNDTNIKNRLLLTYHGYGMKDAIWYEIEIDKNRVLLTAKIEL